MGVLTDDISRLVGEIKVGRGNRAELVKDLRRRAKDLEEEVSTMRSRFRQNHHNMARETLSERLRFVSGLDKTVTSLLRSFNADLAGAHRAWVGLSPIERKALQAEKERRLETQRRAKKEIEEAPKKAKKEAEKKGRGEALQQRPEEKKKMVLATVSKSFKSSKPEKIRNKNKIKGKTN